MAYFKINGVDYIKYIKNDGLVWSRNDIDGKNAGRTYDAVMHRARVGTKAKFEVSLIPLEDIKFSQISKAVAPEYVDVSYLDPFSNSYVTKTFYSSSMGGNVLCYRRNGKTVYIGGEFHLIEK